MKILWGSVARIPGTFHVIRFYGLNFKNSFWGVVRNGSL